MNNKLKVNFCGLDFQIPFIIAASPASDSRKKIEEAFEAGWGGAVLKTTSLKKEDVDLVYPMMAELSRNKKKDFAFFNIDLISERHIDEVEKDIEYIKSKYPENIIIGSIMASSKNDWIELVERLEAVGVDMIECSMSCPQGGTDGTIPVTNPELTAKVTGWINNAIQNDTPFIVKLSPNVTDIVSIGKAAEEAGADALCAIDTVKAMSGVNLETFEPLL